MADASRLAHARPWTHSVPVFREPLRALEPRRCWVNQMHGEIAGEPEKTQHGRVLPPAVVDEIPGVPYGTEKLMGAGSLTQHPHTRVWRELSPAAIRNHRLPRVGLEFGGDVVAAVDDGCIGVDPYHQLVHFQQALQKRDLRPCLGPRLEHRSRSLNVLVAVFESVTPKRLTGVGETLRVR